MEEVQIKINDIKNLNTISDYNNIFTDIVKYNDMACLVYVYDNLKSKGIKPNDISYKIINKLHDKKIPDKKVFNIPFSNKKTLQPRRRIHKIMKGYNTKQNYHKAMINKPNVEKYILDNKINIFQDRINNAKQISKECNISFNDARYIITSLKKSKKKPENNKPINEYFNNT